MITYIGALRGRPALRTAVLIFRSVALVLSSSRPCHAWTETKVVSAHARVDARASERAQVQLTLGLRVNAGWLTHFELLDLGPELLPESAHIVDGQGHDYTPTVHATDHDSLLLEFPDRAQAPKAGDYTLTVIWTSRLQQQDDLSSTWALPRWPNRVPNARIEVLAPRGSLPVANADPAPRDVNVQELAPEQATLLQFTRAELPRTEGFAVSWARPHETPTQQALRALEQGSVHDGIGAGLELLCLLGNALSTASISGCD